MTDRLPKTEVEELRERVQQLEHENYTLRVGHPPKVTKVPWWVRLFGRKVYEGPETCGHCRYWKPPLNEPHWQFNQRTQKREIKYYYGDCKLLFGETDTIETETCPRFQPKREFMHRVKR